jgi:hypothetical protein
MKFLFVCLVVLFSFSISPIIKAETITTENYNSGETYNCPDCGCSLFWTGKELFCVGIRCRHVQFWRCACCGKEWQIYVN